MEEVTWLDILQGLFYLAGILAVVGSGLQYRSNSQQQRFRWLFDLYLRFYADHELQEMLSRIDWEETTFVQEEDRDLLARLDQFLNFFEFVAILVEEKRLRLKEVAAMFDYPLRKIADDKDVAGYVARQEYGYEKLNDLLRKLGYAS